MCFMLQDICLFSDVAVRLGSNTYRMPARRFLQELFLDSTFEAVSYYKKNYNYDVQKKFLILTSQYSFM